MSKIMNSLRIIKNINEMKSYRSELVGPVGFVPTMGALHDGHASLLRQSVKENKSTVLSIYVNPTQFNNSIDLEKYPITLNEDFKIAEDCGVSAVFLPEYNDIYPDHYRYKITESEFSKQLCGAYRPGHFDGVLTIVMKLLQIVKPQRAYFGEKDFQQLKLIEDMVRAFFLDVEIIRATTVREKSGLAMSSRNKRLSEAGLIKAAEIYRALTNSKTSDETKSILTELGFEVEYVSDIDGRRYVAAFLEGVRLIDNVKV